MFHCFKNIEQEKGERSHLSPSFSCDEGESSLQARIFRHLCMIFLLAEKPTQNFEEKTQLLSHIFYFITIASNFGKNPHFHLKPHSLHYLRPPSFSFSEEKRNRKTEEARFSPILLHFPPSFSPHLAAFQRQFALFFGRIFPICFTGGIPSLQGAVFQFGLPYPAAVFVGLLVLSSHQQIPRRWMNSRFAEKIKISQMRLALLCFLLVVQYFGGGGKEGGDSSHFSPLSVSPLLPHNQGEENYRRWPICQTREKSVTKKIENRERPMISRKLWEINLCPRAIRCSSNGR